MNESDLARAALNVRFELDGRVSESARRLRAAPDTLRGAANPNIDRIITAEMDIGIQPALPEVVEIAESYHALFRRNKAERALRLGHMHSQLGRPGDIVTMLYCAKFVPLFENWLASCDTHGIEVRNRLIVFSLDEEAHARTGKLGVKSFFLDPRLYGEAGGSSGFGDRQFSRTMFYKNAIVRDLLELGVNVLFQDVDLVWLKDPLAYFARHDAGDDLYFMYDGPNRHHRPIHANTGFFYARCNDACKALFETALGNTSAIFTSGSHQRPLNRILAHFLLHNVLAVKVLPQSEFLNGHLFNLQRGLSPLAENWQSRGYVAHYSWTRNLQEKREKIQQFGFNYLPGSRLLDALPAG